jgi:hypothetical protein
MQELTFEQVESVSGGNPVVAMVAVVAIRAATPYAIAAAKLIATTVVTTAAGIAGYNAGSES